MRLIALIRVSTRGQADDGNGLDVQRARITEWAKAHGHRITAWVVEAGVSGATPVDQRADLIGVLRDVAARKADGVVVPQLDRLARDLIVQEQLIAEFERIGGVVRSANPTEDDHLLDADPQRVLVRQILGSINQYERAMIRARTRAGRARKAAAGGFIGGRPPYGWTTVGGELVQVPAEQAIRRRIKDMRKRGMALRAIAEKLNSEGKRTKDGTLWQANSVARVVNFKCPGGIKDGDDPDDTTEGDSHAAKAS